VKDAVAIEDLLAGDCGDTVAGDEDAGRFIRNELPNSVFWDLRIGWMVRWNPASILVDGPYLLSTESTEVSRRDRPVLFD